MSVLNFIHFAYSILEQAGVVTRPNEGFEPEQFVNGEIARFE
jgi:hypothetical protein